MLSPARLRVVIFSLLAGIGLAAAATAFSHPTVRSLLHDPRALGASAQNWAQDNPAIAEIAFVLVFTLLTMTALPIWWLQVLAGYVYGLFGGTIRCAIAASIAATITAQLWHWLAADLADHTIMRRVRVLHMLKHYSSDGGFLVVIITRLVHLVPFGLSNYLFGMLEIPWHAVLVGTAIGTIPSAALYVCVGAGVNWHTQWPFVLTIGLIAIAGLVAGGQVYARHRASHGDNDAEG